MSRSESEYVLGTDATELARLEIQHRLWRPTATALWSRAGFSRGWRILDVGSGPGFAAFDLADCVGPQGRVHAVDESARFIAHLKHSAARRSLANVTAQVADVQNLPADVGPFDAAYARWVLCFTPRPRDAVASVARAVRPGGVFAIQDYFNYEALTLAPRTPIFDRVRGAIAKSWRDAGGDPDVVAHLPGWLNECGFRVHEIKAHSLAIRPTDEFWAWPNTFFASFLPRLVTSGHLKEAEWIDFQAEWGRRCADDASFFLTPTVFDVIAERLDG